MIQMKNKKGPLGHNTNKPKEAEKSNLKHMRKHDTRGRWAPVNVWTVREDGVPPLAGDEGWCLGALCTVVCTTGTMLKECQEFEDRISAMTRENFLNKHLITNSSEGPQHGSKHHPEEASLLAGITCRVLQELSEVLGLLVRAQRLLNKAP
jgi:hypothetical protein